MGSAGKPRTVWAFWAVVLFASLGLSGCSGASPGTVVEDFIGLFESEEESTEVAAVGKEEPTPIPGEEQPFPNLGSVPDNPPPVSSQERIDELLSGLVADREHARYTNEQIRGGSPPETTAPAPREPLLPEPAIVPEEHEDQTSAPEGFGREESPPSASSRADERVIPEADRSVVGPSMASVERAEIEPAALTQDPSVNDDTIERFKRLFREEFEASGEPEYAAANPSGQQAHATLDLPSSPLPDTRAGITPGIPADFNPTVVYFANGRAELSQSARAALRRVAELYASTGGRIRVIGHASRNTGSGEELRGKLVNFQLSLDRAQAVGDELMRLGVPPGALYLNARGESMPVADESTAAEEARNRRAEVFIER